MGWHINNTMRILSVSREGVIVRLGVSIDGLSIVKVLTKGDSKIGLHNKISRLDPGGERFGIYKQVGINSIFTCDELKCIQSKTDDRIKPIGFLSPSYDWIDPKGLSRKQYRHLRDSVTLLAVNGIAHLDLPDNVMLNTKTSMPVIIDFGEAVFGACDTETRIDRAAFLSHFKVRRV